jgi:hypothetical protein
MSETLIEIAQLSADVGHGDAYIFQRLRKFGATEQEADQAIESLKAERQKQKEG